MTDPSSQRRVQKSPLPVSDAPTLDLRALEEAERRPLREYWHVLRKRRWLIGAVLSAVALSVALFTFLTTPIYTAETVLLIELPPEPLEANDDYHNTQREILQGHGLAAAVIRGQRLDQDERFAASPREPVAWLLSWFPEKTADANDVEPTLIDAYADRLTVEPFDDSRLMKLTFSSPSAELSAQVVNAHARAYVAQQLELRTRASEDARAFLQDRLAELESRVGRSEGALETYRDLHDIVGLAEEEGANIVIERLAALNERLTEAEAEGITREAEVRLIGERDPGSLPAVVASPLVATLRGDLARLEAEYAHLSTKFKPGYGRLVELQSRIRESRRRLQTEIRSIVESIESAHLAALSNERELRARLEAQKTEALRLANASIEYAILEHEATADRQLRDSVRERIKETSMAGALVAPNVFVIDEAYAPSRPSHPRRGTYLAFGVLLGLLGGVGLAFFAERREGIGTPQEVERYLRLPSLGAVPDFKSLPADDVGLAKTIDVSSPIDVPSSGSELVLGNLLPSAITGAYGSIRNSILRSKAGGPPGTILFSSAEASEGKTTTALSTAVMLARQGSPVLVVDSDLRNPSCHEVLGLDNDAGLTEVLTGQRARLKKVEVLQTEFFFLAAGEIPPDPPELLGSQRMKEVLAELRKRFEYIVIDAPPVLSASDSLVLSTLVDGVVLVLDQQETRRLAAKAARARLAYADAKVLGVVLNRTKASSRGDT